MSAILATAATLVIAGARIVGLGGDPSRFVVAGDAFVDRLAAPPALAILPASSGYDGQFFYRLALDPFTSQKTAFGIALDLPARRQQRILYPLLAWCISSGDPSRVAWALIGLNVAGMGILGWLGALWARDCGRHALCGLAFPAYPGFVLTLGRDLSEILSACLALAGLFALRRERGLAAGVLLALAVLARESALIIVLAVAAVWVWDQGFSRGARRDLPTSASLGFAVPLWCAAAWQVVLRERWNISPATTAIDAFGVPFVALAQFVVRAPFIDSPFRTLQVFELAFLALCLGTVGLSLRSSTARSYEKVAWLLALASAMSFSRFVWVEDFAFMRVLTELYVLGTIILFGRRGRLVALVAVAAGLLWITSAVLRIRII